jgi:lipoyl(octanoyl) transferase
VLIQDCGLIDFHKARELQNQLVQDRISGKVSDALIFCEHPLTLSIGKRTSTERKLELQKTDFNQPASIVLTDRGGEETLHLLGQIVIYPVIHLSKLNFGVKKYVELGLSAITRAIRDCGLSADYNLEVPGIWVKNNDKPDFELAASKKLGAVGIRIERGVTNHGFSLNYDCDLEPFKRICPCGLKGVEVSSVENELKGKTPEKAKVLKLIEKYFIELFR